MRFIRHALNHLVRASDPLPDRFARVVTPGEVYSIPGLGLGFWSAVLATSDVTGAPVWCPATELGLMRLGLVREVAPDLRTRFAAVAEGFAHVRTHAPDRSASEVAQFLECVSRVVGRELPPPNPDPTAFAWSAAPTRVEQALREVRVRTPLKQRIRCMPESQAQQIRAFEDASTAAEYGAAIGAFRAAFPDSPWETALPALDDAYSPALSDADRGRLWSEVARVLRERFRTHPFELADLVVAVASLSAPHGPRVRRAGPRASPRSPSVPPVRRPGPRDDGAVASESCDSDFGGFCSDTFAFLSELSEANAKDWMAEHRDRYQFVLREPLNELCDAVAGRYVEPVLNREYPWNLECDARPGRAVTSICKNDFGRGGPYQPVQWITFYRKAQANKRADAQLFVRVAADGVRYGFHLGRTARDAGKQFRRNVQEHADLIVRALTVGNVFAECRFWTGDDLATEVTVRNAADLRGWATHKGLGIGKYQAPGAALLRTDELVGEVLLTFDRLIPVFACAAEADPRPLLTRRAGAPDSPPPYGADQFHRETLLPSVWLDRALGLLRMKKQFVLQGVPGTGKTHVARCLARLLTRDASGAVRLVQFHPGYSYEEFVEGIRARPTGADGGGAVAFPVEDGVLCQFAEQARVRPSEPHVLIVDELNRGNLPRVFGELLYLLEYRDQAITLPYSKREFTLPENLFILATMNPLDRSAVALDQALRRRFSFVDMPADPAILASWLDGRADPAFGPRVVLYFEELNRRLARDLGPERQVGHSLFMVPDLDDEQLRAVWEHHVRPLLLDYLGGREDRLRDYAPDRLLGARPDRRKAKVASEAE